MGKKCGDGGFSDSAFPGDHYPDSRLTLWGQMVLFS
jgi:hypothetical protein